MYLFCLGHEMSHVITWTEFFVPNQKMVSWILHLSSNMQFFGIVIYLHLNMTKKCKNTHKNCECEMRGAPGMTTGYMDTPLICYYFKLIFGYILQRCHHHKMPFIGLWISMSDSTACLLFRQTSLTLSWFLWWVYGKMFWRNARRFEKSFRLMSEHLNS